MVEAWLLLPQGRALRPPEVNQGMCRHGQRGIGATLGKSLRMICCPVAIPQELDGPACLLTDAHPEINSASNIEHLLIKPRTRVLYICKKSYSFVQEAGQRM
jgi:hypothetical protein